MGVNLDTLRPEPCVEGYSTPGGYSYRAVKPIALERVMSISTMLASRGFRERGVSLSGIGGVETGGDAAEFILLGADTVQVGCIRRQGGSRAREGCMGDTHVGRQSSTGARALGSLGAARLQESCAVRCWQLS